LSSPDILRLQRCTPLVQERFGQGYPDVGNPVGIFESRLKHTAKQLAEQIKVADNRDFVFKPFPEIHPHCLAYALWAQRGDEVATLPLILSHDPETGEELEVEGLRTLLGWWQSVQLIHPKDQPETIVNQMQAYIVEERQKSVQPNYATEAPQSQPVNQDTPDAIAMPATEIPTPQLAAPEVAVLNEGPDSTNRLVKAFDELAYVAVNKLGNLYSKLLYNELQGEERDEEEVINQAHRRVWLKLGAITTAAPLIVTLPAAIALESGLMFMVNPILGVPIVLAAYISYNEMMLEGNNRLQPDQAEEI
jgi:hypothetical protein